MAAKRKPPAPPPGTPAYMLTWGDICTLLLCFFAFLLSMSSISPAKFDVASSSFMKAFSGVLEQMPQVLITKEIQMPRMGGDEQNKKMAVDAARMLQDEMKKSDNEDLVKVKVTDSGIAIKLADPVCFAVGSSDLQPDFIRILTGLRDVVLNKMPGAEIRVEGHTDDTPIHTTQFPSNWELSASRALQVVKFMKDNLGVDPARLSAVGYGEYRPVFPNTSAENRAKNRRIEVYVEYLEKKEQ
jgi:chemotaxis protein MotB